MRKRSQRDQATADTNYRSLIVRAATFNEETRSVEAVISTEQPVDMPDWGRQAMVPEVLVPSGAEFPSNRQVPFLDSHQRRSVKDQLGSAREIKVNGNEITATLVFRKSKESDDALGGVRDGHITDVSVGYDVLKRQYIEAGANKTIGNRTYEGPLNVVTKWRLREVSLTPIGADDQAKLRGLDPAKVRFKSSEEQEDFTMNAELRALLLSKGMSADLTDEQAQRWLIDNAAKLGEVKKEEKKEERSQQTQTLPTAADLAKLVSDATRQSLAKPRRKKNAASRTRCHPRPILPSLLPTQHVRQSLTRTQLARHLKLMFANSANWPICPAKSTLAEDWKTLRLFASTSRTQRPGRIRTSATV